MEDGKYITTKEDKAMHGIGLANLERILARHNGHSLIEYYDDVFIIVCMLMFEVDEPPKAGAL